MKNFSRLMFGFGIALFLFSACETNEIDDTSQTDETVGDTTSVNTDD